MNIIDAHIHFYAQEHFNQLAIRSGHQNTEKHLREVYAKFNIVHAVVMGNRSLLMEDHIYPSFMSYCIGLDHVALGQADTPSQIALIAQHLQRTQCVGIKLYPGYNLKYVDDPDYYPIYELAEQYSKPVAIHTGVTAGGMGRLRYCHPLTVDDVASQFPRVQFVMCHFGNPYLVDAAAVLSKNKNVVADLSGMLEGELHMDTFFRDYAAYMDQIKLWTGYTGAYDRLLFGTDWPLVSIQNYLDFAAAIIPTQHLQDVLFDNANRVYRLGF